MLSGYRYIDCLEHLSVRELIDDPAYGQDNPSLQALRHSFEILQNSPTAAYLLDEVVAYDFKLSIDDDLSWDETGFERDSATLLLPSFTLKDMKLPKNTGRILMTLASGLRRALKANQGHMERFDLKPLEFLRLNRIVEADIDAVTVQICWELRTAGDPTAWRQLLAGERGDLAVVFTNALKTYPMGQFNGKALRYVFRQWFADASRPNEADHMALEFLDMAIACPDIFTITADQNMTENDLRKIQKNLPFQDYLEDINVFGKWFDGLRDPFNQVHLHHIIDEMKSIKII